MSSLERYKEGYERGVKERAEHDPIEDAAKLASGVFLLEGLGEAFDNEDYSKGLSDGRNGRKFDPTSAPSMVRESERAAEERVEAQRQKKAEQQREEQPRRGSDIARALEGDNDAIIGICVTITIWVGGFLLVLFALFMALAITVMLSPIWLGAVTAGVITGFIFGNVSASRIPHEALARIPIVQEQKRKKTRPRIAEEFLKATVKFNPHLLYLIGATAGYGLALSAWPLFTSPDTFTRILLGVGVVAGTILGTLVGRRVLSWQYENRIFELAKTESPTRLFAPKVALGFAIPGLVALASVWIVALVRSPGSCDFAKSFGFKSESQTAQTQSGSSVEQSASMSSRQVAKGDFRALLHDNFNAFVDPDRGDFVVELDWMARLGATRTVVPVSALLFEQSSVGETLAGGAFRDSTVVRIPIRDGQHGICRIWASDPNVDEPWNSGVAPKSEERVTGVLEMKAKGPTEAADLVAALRRLSPATASDRAGVHPVVGGGSGLVVEVVDGIAPGGGGLDGDTLLLRRGNEEIGRFPTFGYVLNFYASPDQRFIAVNNRRGNSGDYLWIVTADGRVLKRPEDGLGQQIEREAVEIANRVAQLRSPAFQGEKTWINAIEWKDDSSLSVTVRTLHIIPNRDSLKQDVQVILAVSRNGASIDKIVLPRDAASADSNVESFIRARLLTEASHDLDRILGNYAERVNYWDNGIVDREFIRKDKAAYFERWPDTREEIEGPIDVTRNSDDWIARFKTRFRVENPGKGVVIQGIQEATYSLRYSNGAFTIAGENGQVLEKQKFENPGAAVSQPGNYPGERFPQTRAAPLSPQDLAQLSAEDLRYAINEMFARYGADFPKEDVKRQFSRFSWYRPRPGVDFDEIESRFFSELERDNLKRLGEARDAAGSRGSTVTPSQSRGGASLRPTSKSRFVTTRDLKKLAGQAVKDTWFAGDFVVGSISGNTLIIYPTWGNGFVRGYSTEIRATFRNGVPPFAGRERLPMDPIDSTAFLRIEQNQPLRIISATRALKSGTHAEIVVVRAEQ